MITNKRGGRQNPCDVFTQLPSKAIIRAAALVSRGIKTHGKNNWRKIEVDEHLDHALYHIFKYMDGDESEEHIVHALVRMMFACEVEGIYGRPDFTEEGNQEQE